MSEQIVYLRDGRKCHVLHRDAKRVFVAVRVEYENWEGEIIAGEEDGMILSLEPEQVFEQPPRARLDNCIVQLNKQIVALQEQACALKLDVMDSERAHEKKMVQYAKRDAALVNLDEFINGKITHYIVGMSYDRPEILTVEETIKTDAWRNKRRGRLLSLTVDPTGKGLYWDLNTYSDGSGSGNRCLPCTSYEAARQILQNWLNDLVTEGAAYQEKHIAIATKYDLALPTGYVEALIARCERRRLLTADADDKRAEEAAVERECQYEGWRSAGKQLEK